MFCKKYKKKIEKLEAEIKFDNHLIKTEYSFIHKLRDQIVNLKKSNKNKDKTIANLRKSIKNHIRENK